MRLDWKEDSHKSIVEDIFGLMRIKLEEFGWNWIGMVAYG